MKAKFDKVINRRKKVIGIVTQLVGRIRGSNRSRKLVYTWGKLAQQDRLHRIDYSAGAINSRYGSLGIKILCSFKYFPYFKSYKLIKELNFRSNNSHNLKLIKDTLRSHIKSLLLKKNK
jgi:ribosomal protein S3